MNDLIIHNGRGCKTTSPTQKFLATGFHFNYHAKAYRNLFCIFAEIAPKIMFSYVL